MEILGELRVICKHLRKHPLGNLFLACLDVDDCSHCKTIPSEKLEASRFIWSAWSGNFPNMVLSATKNYLSFLDHSKRNGNRGADPLPPELAVSWRKCSKCICFYYRNAIDLQRHLHLCHSMEDLKVTDLDPSPFVCSHRLDRKLDEDGIPCGPFHYCNVRFISKASLKQHKGTLGHKRPAKNPNVAAPLPLPLPGPGDLLLPGNPLEPNPNDFLVNMEVEVAPPLPQIIDENPPISKKRLRDYPAPDELPPPLPQEKRKRRGLTSDESSVELLRGERDQLVRFGNVKRAKKSIQAMFYSGVRSDSAIRDWKRALVDATNDAEATIDRLSDIFDDMISFIEAVDDDVGD